MQNSESEFGQDKRPD